MSLRRLSAASLLLAAFCVHAAPPPTLRVDLVHSGNALSAQYALERVVIEPLP